MMKNPSQVAALLGFAFMANKKPSIKTGLFGVIYIPKYARFVACILNPLD